MRAKTVAIIGAGPVDLAAGAHALERGLSVVILPQGYEAGHSIRQWQHVKMFSPWEFNVSCGTVRPHGARELAHPEVGFYILWPAPATSTDREPAAAASHRSPSQQLKPSQPLATLPLLDTRLPSDSLTGPLPVRSLPN
jgi:hypothetical protein